MSIHTTKASIYLKSTAASEAMVRFADCVHPGRAPNRSSSTTLGFAKTHSLNEPRKARRRFRKNQSISPRPRLPTPLSVSSHPIPTKVLPTSERIRDSGYSVGSGPEGGTARVDAYALIQQTGSRTVTTGAADSGWLHPKCSLSSNVTYVKLPILPMASLLRRRVFDATHMPFEDAASNRDRTP